MASVGLNDVLAAKMRKKTGKGGSTLPPANLQFGQGQAPRNQGINPRARALKAVVAARMRKRR